MIDPHRDPTRWKDRTDQSDLAEHAAGNAFRCAAAEPRQIAPPLSRVAARIHGSRPPRRLAWVFATSAFILGLAAAASAMHLDLLPAWLTSIVKTKTAVPALEGARRAKAVSPSSSTKATQPSPAPEQPVTAPVGAQTTPPTPALAPSSDGRASASPRKLALVERDHGQPAPSRLNNADATRRVGPSEVVSTTPRATTNSLPDVVPSSWPVPTIEPARTPSGTRSVAEIAPPGSASPAQAPLPKAPGVGRYLAEAIGLLRKEREPASALRLLDRHEPALAQAGFGHEALILRVEALLALGRRAEVLHLLDSAVLADVAASRALLITRGELRTAANRCTEAMGDFDLVLARARQVDRQALAGRALCRKKLGDLPGAHADIERLREEFPNERLPGELER